jgi:hypothetical protein
LTLIDHIHTRGKPQASGAIERLADDLSSASTEVASIHYGETLEFGDSCARVCFVSATILEWPPLPSGSACPACLLLFANVPVLPKPFGSEAVKRALLDMIERSRACRR